ncbi:MAG: flippase-like domain-containing protein [Muribaculaceae bacterium]|nr:flippase-like domain-containing protein [Muribaculaceae bacterium]
MTTAPTTNDKNTRPHERIRTILRAGASLGLTALLIGWLFHEVDFHKVEAIIREGFSFRWIAAMMVVNTLSHIIRGVRWGIQLRAAGIPRMSATAESVSIFGAYALNLVLPWLGEAWRVVYVSRRENAKLTTVIGTDFGDRLSDAAVILLLIIFSFFVVRPELLKFIDHYSLGEEISRVFTSPMLWSFVGGAVIIVAAIAYIFRHSGPEKKFFTGVERVWDGFKVIFTMPGRGLYIVYTFGIWICYFLQYYLCLFAFPFTRELITAPGMCYGLLPGLVMFVFGSCSMGVPSNGGLGPWNIAVMFALSLYGVKEADGTAFSLVVWTFQNIAQVAMGIFAAVYVFTHRRKTLAPANA